MFERGAAPATGRSPVASRIPLSGSGEERTARRVEGVARGRLPVAQAAGAAAAMGGHLEVLQWARENGCPWNKQTCHNAAKCGHLEVLQWARANDCQCDRFTCAWAAMVDIARYCSGCVRTAARGTGGRALPRR